MSAAPRPSAPDVPVPKEAGYEFADAQKENFSALAGSMSFVGVCTMLFGPPSCIFLAGLLYSGIISGAVATAFLEAACLLMACWMALTGWWMVSAGRSLSALVATRGRDVDHLMKAMKQVGRLFALARVVIVVVAVAVLAGAGLVLWCTLAVDKGGKCFGLGV